MCGGCEGCCIAQQSPQEVSDWEFLPILLTFYEKSKEGWAREGSLTYQLGQLWAVIGVLPCTQERGGDKFYSSLYNAFTHPFTHPKPLGLFLHSIRVCIDFTKFNQHLCLNQLLFLSQSTYDNDTLFLYICQWLPVAFWKMAKPLPMSMHQGNRDTSLEVSV